MITQRKPLYTLLYSIIILLFCSTLCWAQAWVSEGVVDLEHNKLFYSLQNFNPPEKKIVVTVTAYNVKDWYERNLGSIFGQKYSNYRVMYVDDRSTDGTPELVERFIQQAGQVRRVTLIKNKEWLSQLANHYVISHMCDDDEIIVNVDSDDWFKHEQVLSLINKVYSRDPNIWVTCGGSQLYPDGWRPTAFITKEIIQSNTYRETRWDNWAWWHPRTYYAWLFKQIRLRDLLVNSSFKPLAPSPDSAFMYPVLEMAGNHTYYIADDLYRWNTSNPLSQHVVSGTKKQWEVDHVVVGWQKYQPLDAPRQSPAQKYSNCKADLIILYNQRDMLNSDLIKLIKKTKGLRKIYLLYEHDTAQNRRFFLTLKRDFAQVEYVYTRGNLKQALLAVLNKTLDHVIFAHTTQISKRERNISVYIRELERTFAAGFYIGISDHKERDIYIPEHVTLPAAIGAWQFKDGQAAGSHMFSLNWVLYRKYTIIDKIGALSFISCKDFERAWYNLNNNKALVNRSVGLFSLF